MWVGDAERKLSIDAVDGLSLLAFQAIPLATHVARVTILIKRVMSKCHLVNILHWFLFISHISCDSYVQIRQNT